MISDALLKKIRALKIYTRKMVSGSLIGDHTTAQRGYGLEFDQMRDYQLGDDVRAIDWKGSARAQKMLVKEYIQERNRTIMLLVDVSASSFYATQPERKITVLQELASVLSVIAEYGKDRIGAVLYAHDIELVIPPAVGKLHVNRLIEQLMSFVPRSTTTRSSVAAAYLAKLKRKDMVVLWLSDFIDDTLSDAAPLLARRYKVCALRVLEPLERCMPPVGLINTVDYETGETYLLDCRARKNNNINDLLTQRLADQQQLLRRNRVPLLNVNTEAPWVGNLAHFLRSTQLY
jgi:uncharacterized protein (DUF58 family)